MFRSWKIRTKLIAAYAMVALLLAVVCSIGYAGMRSINANLVTTYEDCLTPITLLGRVQAAELEVRGDVYKFICMPDARDPLEQATEDHMAEADREFELFKKSQLQEDQKEATAAYELAWRDYKVACREALRQVRAGNENEALASCKTGRIYSLRTSLDKSVGDLITICEKTAKQAREQGDRTFNTASMTGIGAAIVAILLAVIIGIAISRGISVPLARTVQMIQELGRGHLGMRLRLDTADEVGIMARTLDDFADNLQNTGVGLMRKIAAGDLSTEVILKDDKDEIALALKATVESLRGLVAEVNSLTKAAVAGRLATRGNAERFQGGYREIVQGINDSLDAFIFPINEVSEVLKKTAACDFSVRVTGEYSGDHQAIKNSLNQSMEVVQTVIKDVSDIVGRFAAGDLTVKANEANYRGDVVQLAKNLNSSIEALKAIISRIRTAASAVASAADEISASSVQITKGAQNQASAANETSASMEEMSVSIQGVANIAVGLASNVDETTSSIQQMGTTAESVAKNAESMSSNVSETSSTIEQMVVTLEKTAKNVEKADQLSQQASDEAKGGGEAVLKTVTGMRAIGDMMGNITTVIQNLGQRSEAIGRIVEVIEEIADQTNLLALNAAIEAARAGDAGRGFAVVADEVRKLAERSIKATKEIGEVIRQVQKDTSSAVRAAEEGAVGSKEGMVLADRAGAAIGRITEAVNAASQIMRDIARATSEQSQAAKNVTKAVEDMNRLTASVTQSTREQAGGVKQIVKASEDMAQMTEKVKNATSEQKRGGEGVVKAVENISDIAKTNLSAVEQLSNSAKDLAKQSEALIEMVQEFKVA